MAYPSPEACRRKALQAAIAAVAAEVNIHRLDKMCLETLTEILHSYLTEMGKLAHSYAELSQRTQPNCFDVQMAMADMGVGVDEVKTYAYRPVRFAVNRQHRQLSSAQPRLFHVGPTRPHPPSVPSYLPPFPDPHTYIRTSSYRKPVSDHKTVREKMSTQERNVEQALHKFVVKTEPADPVHVPSQTAPLCSVIQPKVTEQPAYLRALMPRDEDHFDPPQPDLTSAQPTAKEGNGDMSNDVSMEEGVTESLPVNPFLQLPRKISRLSKKKAVFR